MHLNFAELSLQKSHRIAWYRNRAFDKECCRKICPPKEMNLNFEVHYGRQLLLVYKVRPKSGEMCFLAYFYLLQRIWTDGVE